MQVNLKRANEYLPHILLIGIGIGTANYIMNDTLNWVQWVIQSLSTNFLIGYPLVIIASNKPWLKSYINTTWRLYGTLFLTFFLLGVVATEMEQIIRTIIFSTEKYQFFSASKLYLFNGIISLVLGFSFFQNSHFFLDEYTPIKHEPNDLSTQKDKSEKTLDPPTSIINLPVKQGENILLIPIQNIVYLEAFDNYSFVYDLKGEKRLCDYSLLFLQKRLGNNFLRIHRKYIVNTNHIKQFKPHLNARYLIQFKVAELSPIISSKSYSNIIRALIRIK